MQWLANIAVRRPVFASVLMLVVVVVGLAGYGQLGVDRFPKVDFPMIMIITRLPGAAPEEVESEISDKIEEAVNTVSGLDELQSMSSEGVSQVFATFSLEKDVDVAAQEVRERVAAVTASLPAGIDAPTVMKLDPDASPVIYLSVKADKPLRDITWVADHQVRRRLESIAGVGQVTLLGGQKRQINVFIDPVKLRAYNLNAADVQRALAGQNLSVPGGRIEAGPEELTLRIRGRVSSPEALGELVLAQKDGHTIHVHDVARVEDGGETIDSAAFKNGVSTVVLALRKQSGANTISVVDGIRETVVKLGGELPRGYSLEVVRDASETVRTSVDAVTEHLVLGALFAALIVLLFLGNVRSTIIAAVAIPISVIGTFGLMWAEGFTLNTITLLALALAVGIVIDDAIVVLENIFRFIDEKGVKPFPAAILATKEIGLAVLATTLSLIAVFLPVAFMSGIVGRFLKSFGLTMAFSILVSLLVSFTLTPMLSARWLRPARLDIHGNKRRSVLEKVVDVVYHPIERVYMAALRWVMRHRWVVVVVSLLVLASIVPLGAAVPKGFLPESDEAQFLVNVRAPEGTSLDATSIIAERIARRVRADIPHVDSTLVTVADDNMRTQNKASIFVKLTPPDRRKLNQFQLMEKVRTEIVAKEPKELRIAVNEVPMFSGGMQRYAITYVLSGPELGELEKNAAKALDALKALPGVIDADSSLVTGKPEVVAEIRRDRAADLGVQIPDIAYALRLLVGDVEVSRYQENGEQFEIHARAEKEYRSDVNGLSMLTVPSMKLGSVRLSDVVDLVPGTGPSEIRRLNRERQVTINANVASGYSNAAITAAFEKSVAELKMPAGYRLTPIGESKEMGKAAKAFTLAFVLSFVFMYLILAAQFESWLHPITILVSLPLTVPFALASLFLFGQSLNIFSSLGILVLFGVVKKNSILQIDHTNGLRAAGVPRDEAILQANKDRLRPILMTTLAFVAGMIPLVTSTGIGSGMNRATAGVVVGGQVLSLALTLLATPVAYSLFDDLSAWFQRVVARLRRAEDRDLDLGQGELAALDDRSVPSTPAH